MFIAEKLGIHYLILPIIDENYHSTFFEKNTSFSRTSFSIFEIFLAIKILSEKKPDIITTILQTEKIPNRHLFLAYIMNLEFEENRPALLVKLLNPKYDYPIYGLNYPTIYRDNKYQSTISIFNYPSSAYSKLKKVLMLRLMKRNLLHSPSWF